MLSSSSEENCGLHSSFFFRLNQFLISYQLFFISCFVYLFVFMFSNASDCYWTQLFPAGKCQISSEYFRKKINIRPFGQKSYLVLRENHTIFLCLFAVEFFIFNC